jgi:hypothetical protein
MLGAVYHKHQTQPAHVSGTLCHVQSNSTHVNAQVTTVLGRRQKRPSAAFSTPCMRTKAADVARCTTYAHEQLLPAATDACTRSTTSIPPIFKQLLGGKHEAYACYPSLQSTLNPFT